MSWRDSREFCQGDVIRHPPLFYYADPARPIWKDTTRYTAGSVGPEVVYAEMGAPEYGLITSQTCDISEEDSDFPKKPWVQIAPIFPLEGNNGLKKTYDRGGPNVWVWVPKLPAEASSWLPISALKFRSKKDGWLSRSEYDGFCDDEARQKVGQKLASLRQRPAFGGTFVSLLQRPLRNALRDLRRDEPEAYEQLNAEVDEVAVLMDNRLNPSDVQIVFLTDSSFSQQVSGGVRHGGMSSSRRALMRASHFMLQTFDSLAK